MNDYQLVAMIEFGLGVLVGFLGASMWFMSYIWLQKRKQKRVDNTPITNT